MSINEMPTCNCPYCGHEFNRASSLTSKDRPSPGDLTLCIKCSLVMAFDDDLRVRPLNADELKSLLKEPGLAAFVARTAAVIQHLQAAKN